MGKIFGGLVTAAFTIFLTLFAQNWWSDHQKQTQFEIHYGTTESTLSLSPADLKRIAALNPHTTLRLSIVDIQNTGTEPLTDQRVNIKFWIPGDGGVVASGSNILPGNTDDGLTTKSRKNGFDIDYKLLNPGEKHRIWFIYDGLGVESLTARRPGLRVSSIDRDFTELSILDDPISIAIFSVMGALLTFGLGAAAGWSGLSDEMKKRGFDPEEIMKITPEVPPPPT